MIKESNHQKDIIILIIYTPNIGAPKHIKLITKLKKEIGSSTKLAGHFNTPLPTMDRSSKTDHQYGNSRLEQHYRSKGPNRHTENFPSNSSRIHILFQMHVEHSLG